MKVSSLLIAIAVAAMLTGTALAQRPGRPRPDGDRPRPEGIQGRDGPREGPRRGPPRGDQPPEGRPDGRPEFRPEGGFPGFRLPIIAALDANEDGEISADEIKNAAAALKSLDKNKDGKITAEEMRPDFGNRPGPRAPEARGGEGGRPDFRGRFEGAFPRGGPEGRRPPEGRGPRGDRPRPEGGRERPEGDPPGRPRQR